MTLGLNLESFPNQLSKFGELSRSALKNLVTIRLLTNPLTWTPDRPPTDHWQTLTDPWQFGYYQTPKRVLTDTQWTWCPIDSIVFFLTDIHQTPKQKKFVGDDIRSQFVELSRSALKILVTIRLLTAPPDNKHLTDPRWTPNRSPTDPWRTPRQTPDSFPTVPWSSWVFK
jgi:hypothetical protein